MIDTLISFHKELLSTRPKIKPIMRNSLISLMLLAHSVLLYRHCESKTVVMMPNPSKSYVIYHSNIAKALIDLGHNVFLCVPEYLVNASLVPYKEINIVKYGKKIGNIEDIILERTQIVNHFWEGGSETIHQATLVMATFEEILEKILADENFITSLKDLKPDFFILDTVILIPYTVVLPYKFGVPFGLIGTVPDYHTTRVPYSPAGEAMVYENCGDRKTFFQRVMATIISILLYANAMFARSDVVTRFVPEKPYKTLGEIALEAEIFVTELDHVLDYPRASLPNTKFVGGSSVSDAKPLTGDLKTYVDNSSNGIIVVSFGGGDFEIPIHIKSKMQDAFSSLQQNVVWKINLTLDQPGNILPLKWIPQNDLLGHEKTKVFISHCGKNGQYEALYNGVPILCLPIYGDQFYNSIRISTKEFGFQADIRKITSDELAALIIELVNVPKYKTNIQKASKLFKELYKVPSKEAAYWFDHVMKYGGEYMRSSYQKMPLYEFLLLDVIAFLIVCVIVILLAVYVIIRVTCKCICKVKRSKRKTE